MKSVINWNIFFILLGLSLLSVCAVFPYVITLQEELLNQTKQPVWLIFLLQLIQSLILFSFAIFIGLFLIKKINFHLPVLEALSTHHNYIKECKAVVSKSILLGTITAMLIYISDFIFSILGAEISTTQNLAPIWQKLLAAFYGGITEEIVMRLFLMTILIWVGTKLTKKSIPSHMVIIISIIISAIFFGLGHLPITATLTQITPIIVIRAIILNGIGGIVFGWLYWKKGLESAMIAHFTADIFLLTILPLLLS